MSEHRVEAREFEVQKENENKKNLDAYSPVKNFVLMKVLGLSPLCNPTPGASFSIQTISQRGKDFFFFLTFSSPPLQLVLCEICDLLSLIVELDVQGLERS